MFYTTDQPRMSLTGIIISVKRKMRLNTHDFSIKYLRSETASKTIIDFNVMVNEGLF